MKYIKPHLSPELRAQITPTHSRDVKLTAAGVFMLLLSIGLAHNLWPKENFPLANNNKDLTLTQTQTLKQASAEKQVLGASTEENPQYTQYVVKQGDTLFNISQKYNIKWDLIAQINNLKEPYLLHPGDSLKIPQATTSQIKDKVYTIKETDTLVSIAKQFNITVDDIVAVNPNLQKSDLITVGQIIKLP